MKAHELAKMLLALPDVEVKHVWDGCARTTIEYIWVAQGDEGGEFIATADKDEAVYDKEDKPAWVLTDQIDYSDTFDVKK